jgi:hypothetical protein
MSPYLPLALAVSAVALSSCSQDLSRSQAMELISAPLLATPHPDA